MQFFLLDDADKPPAAEAALKVLADASAASWAEYCFSLMVVPGAGSQVAGLNPSNWSFEPRPAKNNYAKGLGPLMGAGYEDAFTLIDLAALRPVVGMNRGKLDEELFRMAHGFDMLLVMSGSTPSGELDHE